VLHLQVILTILVQYQQMLVLILNLFHKLTSAIKCWLYDDSLYQKLLILNQGC